MITEERKEIAPETASAPKPSDRRKPVTVYILILFLAAFLLMALSLMMHQRSNTETLGKIQSDLSVMQDIQAAQEQLDNIHQQMEAAKEEVEKPFPQEKELKTKSVRLAELDAALNMEEKKPAEHEQEEERPSVRDALKKPCIHGSSISKNTQKQER